MPITSNFSCRYVCDSASVENAGPSMQTYVPPRWTFTPTRSHAAASWAESRGHVGLSNPICATIPPPKNVAARPFVRSKN